MRNLIEIVPYDQRWPVEFRRIGAPLRKVMGDLAVRIDHIGSTAVPGLAAKDVIDVQVTGATLDAGALVPALAPLGYTLWEGITGDHVPPGRDDPPEARLKLFFRAPEGQRRTNLHIRQGGRANPRNSLPFRNDLPPDPPLVAAYQPSKQATPRR